MKKRFLLLSLFVFASVPLMSCVKYNGVSQEEEEKSSPIIITLSTKSLDLKVGDGGKTFTATLSSEEEEIKNNLIYIQSKDESIAVSEVSEVESGAQVRIKGLKEGTTEIIVASKQEPKAIETLAVTVSKGEDTHPVESISVTEDEVTLNIGETSQIEYTILPENATVKNVSFSSSDDSIATVSSTGLITAQKVGTATISVTTQDGGKKAEIALTVKNEGNLTANALYLMGSNSSYSWDTPVKANELIRNENAQSNAEYMITFEASQGDLFKVAKYIVPNEGDPYLDFLQVDPNHIGDDLSRDGCASAESDGYNGFNIKIEKAGTNKFTIYMDLNAVREDYGNKFYKYYVDIARNEA